MRAVHRLEINGHPEGSWAAIYSRSCGVLLADFGCKFVSLLDDSESMPIHQRFNEQAPPPTTVHIRGLVIYQPADA